MTPGQLTGTVALVTGASSGIGEATAAALAAEGAAVALVARRGERLRSLAGRIRDSGGTAFVQAVDITDEAEARQSVRRTVDALGRLDILVNNAGYMILSRVESADTSHWRRMLDVNIAALMNITHAALPHLLDAATHQPRKVADIVNVSSAASRRASAGSGAYNASKWAVNGFSEALRKEVNEQHVRVILIEPGAVNTRFASLNVDPEVVANLRQRFGSLELLNATDVAELILFAATRPRRVAINEVLIRPTEQTE